MEKKATMDELFKDSENFKFNEVDYSSKKMKKQVKKIQEQRERNQQALKINLSDPIWHEPFDI